MRATETTGFSSFAARLLVSGLTLSGAMAATPVRAAHLHVVVLSDDSAPGTPSGVLFDGFSAPILNDASAIAFVGTIKGTGITNSNRAGAWAAIGGSLALVARDGDQAAELPGGVSYSNVNSLDLNKTGQIAFLGNVAGTGVNNTNSQGFWMQSAGGISLVARTGDQAVGMPPGGTYRVIDYPTAFNNSGRVAFLSILADGRVGVWSAGLSSLGPVALQGQQPPGVANGITYLGFDRPELNDAGHTAFRGSLNKAGNASEGIWSDVSGALALDVRRGDPAPGTASGVTFGVFSSLRLNNRDHIGFLTLLDGAGVTAGNQHSFWTNRAGSLVLEARSGNQAVGVPTGVNYGSFDLFRLNNNNQILFQSALIGPGVDSSNNRGLWSDGSGTLTLIARTGNQASDLPNGVTYAGFDVTTRFNDLGQSAFLASLSGVGINTGNNAGIWATDASGMLKRIVQSGDQLEVKPGDFRTVSLLALGSMNNLGQLGFFAGFTDGSRGVFISDLVAISEPHSLAIIGVTVISWVMLSRRQTKQ